MCNKGYNMYKRLKHGEFMAMTPEQKRQHKAMLTKRYKKAHPEKIREINLYFYNLYKKTKPHKCICVKCGKVFNAARSVYKWCDECKNKDWGAIRRQAIIDKRNAKINKHKKVIELAKLGWEQEEIAKQVGYSQRNVSKIMIDAGMRQIKKHTRAKNV